MSEAVSNLPPQATSTAPSGSSATLATPTGLLPAAGPYVSILDSRRKSPALACFLSLMPGLGQVYVGYYQRGFVHAAVVATLMTLLSNNPEELTPLLALFLTFFWLYNIIDAGRRAALYNELLAGRTGIQLPADLMLPGLGGSMIGGAVVVLVGLLLLAHTAFGMSLSWVKEWWPVGVILFGAYLFVKARLDRTNRESAEVA